MKLHILRHKIFSDILRDLKSKRERENCFLFKC